MLGEAPKSILPHPRGVGYRPASKKPLRIPGAGICLSALLFSTALLSGIIASRAQHPGPAASAPFAAFTNWLAGFSVEADAFKRAAMLGEGRRLAKGRRAALLELIKTNPQHALEWSIPDAQRKPLPLDIATNLERQVSGLGAFEVFCVDGLSRPASGLRRGAPEPGESDLYKRFVTLQGERLRAYVYGRRLGQTTKRGIPLHGVALGDELALGESVFVPLGPSGQPAARLGDQVVRFASGAQLQEAEKRLEAAESGLGPEPTIRASDHVNADGTFTITPAASGGGGGGGGGGGSGSTWTTGNKKVLVVRVDFPDLPGAPSGMTAADVQSVADGQIAPYYLASSYGLTSLSNTVTAVYRMPQAAAYYATNNATTQLMADAQSAAGASYNLSQFDRFIVFFASMRYLPNTQFTWTGLSAVGSWEVWINGQFDFGTVAHELGHTYGLYHANLWLVSDNNPISATGRSLEYRDDYDTMGGNWSDDLRTDFNPWFKNLLGWLPTSQIQTVTKSGTYRVNRYDLASASGMLALKIVKDATHNYWASYKGSFTNNPSLENGAYLVWGYNSNNHSDLLDLGTPGNGDQDAGLAVGTSLVDTAANLGIAAVAQGSSGQTPYLDIKVTFGSAAPAIYVQPPSQTVIVGQNAFFPVVAAGIPSPTYRWQCKAAGTAAWTNLMDNSVYSGAMSSGLTVLSPTTAMDSDQFRCILTNASGSVTTAPPAVLSVLPTGVSTLAGLAGAFGWADGTGSAARFRPTGVAADGLGNVYVADRENHVIRKVTGGGVVTTLAGKPQTHATGDGTNNAAGFTYPTGICLDNLGNLYVADTGNNLIRKVRPVGTNWVVTTIAGQVGVAGTSDGPGLSALFNSPNGIGIDPATNLFVADGGSGSVRKLTPSGTNWVVSTLATGLSWPQSVCADKAGNIYVANTFAHVIERIDPAGTVSVLAGNDWGGVVDGTGTEASFSYPYGLAADVLGNLYVTDQQVIRKIAPGAVVSTIAGQAATTGGSDGALTNATFAGLWGVSTDPYGNVYVADHGNYDIRKIVTGPAIPLPRLDGPTLLTHRMRFVLDGPVGTNYYVQVSANLSNWSVLSTNVIPVGGWLTIQDPLTNAPGRFYRASTQVSMSSASPHNSPPLNISGPAPAPAPAAPPSSKHHSGDSISCSSPSSSL